MSIAFHMINRLRDMWTTICRRNSRLNVEGFGYSGSLLEQLEPRVLLSATEVWGPLISFPTWNQDGVYSDYTPENASGDEAAVGCVATAAAQVLQYWQYPDHIDFSSDDNYTSEGGFGSIAIPGDSTTNDFPTFAQLDDALDVIDYNLSDSEKAWLSFGVGVKYEMNYGRGSGASTARGANIFGQDFGFGSTSLLRNRDSSTPWTSEMNDVVIENIKAGRPVLAAICYDDGSNGHSVVIDGYDESNEEFHVNLGWGDSGYDGWHSLPTISAGNYNWTHVRALVYNLMPETGWGQSYAGSDNAKYTEAPIPEELPSEVSWSGSAPSGYRIEQTILAGGGSTFVALRRSTPESGTDYVREYNGKGTLVNEWGVDLATNDRIHGIAQPAKDNGSLYILTGDKLIQMRTSDGYQKTLLTRTDSELDGLKVDDEGNAYCTLWDGMVFKQSPWGNSTTLKTYSTPSGWRIVRNEIAVDETNDRVYVTATNSTTKRSVLVALEKGSLSCSVEKLYSREDGQVVGDGEQEEFAALGPVRSAAEGAA